MSGFSREFWLAIRQALLAMVDAIEHELQIEPRTSEIRKSYKTDVRNE